MLWVCRFIPPGVLSVNLPIVWAIDERKYTKRWGQWSTLRQTGMLSDVSVIVVSAVLVSVLVFFFYCSVFNLSRDVLVCCKRVWISYLYWLSGTARTVFFFLFFFFCCWKLDMNSDSHLKTQSMFNQCFVIVMPFVSNRIAPVVLHVLDYTYKRTRQRRYSTDSKSLHRQSMCSKRVLWKEGSKSHKPGSKMNTLPHLPVYSSPSSSTPYGRLLRRALQNVPCKHAQAKFA